MADISDLHPDVVIALRTGKLPPGATPPIEKAAAHTVEDENPADADEQRFRALYHEMVDEYVADWLDNHPFHGGALPTDEMERIKAYCRDTVQHQWARHLARLRTTEDEHEQS